MVNKPLKTGIIVGIIVLFMVSSVTPMAFGYNVRISIEKEILSTTSRDGGLMDSAWPMFQHDTHHTGRSPFAPSSGNWPVVKWKFWMDGMMISSPAIDENGTIYIGAEDFQDSFFAIYPNGTEKWRFGIGNYILSSPAIGADGTIYVGSNIGKLIATNPNGTEKWRFSAGSWVFSSPTIDEEGTIYIGSTNNNFYAVYPDGSEKWHFETGFKIYSSAAIDDNGIIYFGSHDRYLYALYPNGTLKWKYKTDGELKSPPAIGADGTIYVCSWDYYLYAIYPNGTLRWKFNTGAAAETSPTIAQDGNIYVGNYVGRIFSIDPNGNKNWHYDTGDSIYSSPAVDKNGVIYTGSMDGYLYALNPDGTLRWKFCASDDGIESSAAIGEDGTIYIAAYFKPSGGHGSYTHLYALEVIENEPPNKPTITGRTKGNPGKSYEYTFNAVDPDGDDVRYIIDWGDGKSDTTGYNPSGYDVKVSHTWDSVGEYTITTRAQDEFGLIGPEATGTVIIRKKTRAINGFLLRFLEQFPILRHLLRL